MDVVLHALLEDGCVPGAATAIYRFNSRNGLFFENVSLPTADVLVRWTAWKYRTVTCIEADRP